MYYSSTERFYDLPPIKVILPNSYIEIPIKNEDKDKKIYIGNKGTLYFKTNYDDSETNIFDVSEKEEKTNFRTTLNYTYYNQIYYININCRLWKPLNDKLWLFCKLNSELSEKMTDIEIKNSAFIYKEHAILIEFYSKFTVNTLDSPVPFLYSDKQIINIKEETDSYDLIFRIGLYDEQPLYLSLDELKYINLTLQ